MEVLYTDYYILQKSDGNIDATIVVCSDSGKKLIQHSMGDKNQIEAEGYSILAALKISVSKNIKPVQIRSNSQFWVKSLNFDWNIVEPKLLLIKKKIIEFKEKSEAEIIWAPREQNTAGTLVEKVLARIKKRTVKCPHCHKFLTIDS